MFAIAPRQVGCRSSWTIRAVSSRNFFMQPSSIAAKSRPLQPTEESSGPPDRFLLSPITKTKFGVGMSASLTLANRCRKALLHLAPTPVSTLQITQNLPIQGQDAQQLMAVHTVHRLDTLINRQHQGKWRTPTTRRLCSGTTRAIAWYNITVHIKCGVGKSGCDD